jgi:hypothetical protein
MSPPRRYSCKKRICKCERTGLIQNQAPIRNIDSKNHSLGFWLSETLRTRLFDARLSPHDRCCRKRHNRPGEIALVCSERSNILPPSGKRCHYRVRAGTSLFNHKQAYAKSNHLCSRGEPHVSRIDHIGSGRVAAFHPALHRPPSLARRGADRPLAHRATCSVDRSGRFCLPPGHWRVICPRHV